MKRLMILAALVGALCTVGVFAAPAPAATIDEEASSYLCWNHEMVNPVAYTDSVADEMWATGKYVEPQAVLGNIEGGTNIGAYHLVCNAASTMTQTGDSIGGSGEVYTADVIALFNAEHLITHNDLNQYHVFK